MFQQPKGDGSNDVYSQLVDAGNDVYGFEPIELPELPSGERLVIAEQDAPLPRICDVDDDDDDEAIIRALQYYVDACEDDDNTGVGGELWPAAAFLCRWLRDAAAAELSGSSVVELGAGTGACGVYAAALGASRTWLTDAFSDSLSLCEVNAAANAPLFRDRTSRVDVERLAWGDTLPASVTSAEAIDLVIGSDLTYMHEAHAELAQTLRDLLDLGGSGEVASMRPPRIVLSHEHRSRDHGLPWLKTDVTLESWDAGDPHLALFQAAAAKQGLVLAPLVCQRPRSTMRAGLRSWSADVSVFEVRRG